MQKNMGELSFTVKYSQFTYCYTECQKFKREAEHNRCMKMEMILVFHCIVLFPSLMRLNLNEYIVTEFLRL